MSYKILQALELEGLEAQVKAYEQADWTCQGGVSGMFDEKARIYTFYQAMVKNEQDSRIIQEPKERRSVYSARSRKKLYQFGRRSMRRIILSRRSYTKVYSGTEGISSEI